MTGSQAYLATECSERLDDLGEVHPLVQVHGLEELRLGQAVLRGALQELADHLHLLERHRVPLHVLHLARRPWQRVDQPGGGKQDGGIELRVLVTTV